MRLCNVLTGLKLKASTTIWIESVSLSAYKKELTGILTGYPSSDVLTVMTQI